MMDLLNERERETDGTADMHTRTCAGALCPGTTHTAAAAAESNSMVAVAPCREWTALIPDPVWDLTGLRVLRVRCVLRHRAARVK
jgi:hypothetical protein